MKTLRGKYVLLRALEPEDLSFLYEVENNESFWEISHTKTPFSKFLLKRYIENAHLDIYQAKQVRLIIENTAKKKPIGMIDLFDFNSQHNRAGVGILICPKYQKKGFASEALSLLIHYSFSRLNLHQLYANIIADNIESQALFSKHLFVKTGLKKEWILSKGKYKDELLFQRIKD